MKNCKPGMIFTVLALVTVLSWSGAVFATCPPGYETAACTVDCENEAGYYSCDLSAAVDVTLTAITDYTPGSHSVYGQTATGPFCCEVAAADVGGGVSITTGADADTINLSATVTVNNIDTDYNLQNVTPGIYIVDPIIDAGDGDDIVTGSDWVDLIYGGAGDDTINGKAGDDVIYGGDGKDTLNGRLGNDTIHGEAGKDTINGDGGDDTLYGNGGSDTIDGGAGNDTSDGGLGDDTVLCIEGDDTVIDDDEMGVDTIDCETSKLVNSYIQVDKDVIVAPVDSTADTLKTGTSFFRGFYVNFEDYDETHEIGSYVADITTSNATTTDVTLDFNATKDIESNKDYTHSYKVRYNAIEVDQVDMDFHTKDFYFEGASDPSGTDGGCCIDVAGGTRTSIISTEGKGVITFKKNVNTALPGFEYYAIVLRGFDVEYQGAGAAKDLKKFRVDVTVDNPVSDTANVTQTVAADGTISAVITAELYGTDKRDFDYKVYLTLIGYNGAMVAHGEGSVFAGTVLDTIETATATTDVTLTGASLSATAKMITLVRSYEINCTVIFAFFDAECASPPDEWGFYVNNPTNLGDNIANVSFTGEADLKDNTANFSAGVLVLGFRLGANATIDSGVYTATGANSGLHKEPIECENDASGVWGCDK